MPIIIGRPPSGPSGGGTDHSAEIAAIQAKDQSQDTRIDSVEEVASSADTKSDTNASSISGLTQRVTTLENAPAATDYGPAIIAVQDKNTAQDTRLTNIDSALINKAPLVSGKIPYENLPEFPVGRKVNVAKKAARLALSTYADLTIAYESDTGDAYGLDANSDPAIEANWSKLGNALGIGVASFNGRTGNIGSQIGDYTTNQISETLTKQFVTPEQKTDWSSRETTTGAQTKATTAQTAAVASAKTYADKTFIPLTQKGVANGVAPLGSTGKVPTVNLLTNVVGGVPLLNASGKIPTSQLPANLPTSQRVWRDVKASRIVDSYITHTGGNGNEMMVYVRSANSTSVSRHIVAIVRESSSSPIFLFRSDAYGAAGDRWQHLYLHVPHGWQYSIRSDGGSNTANIELWYEMY